MYYSAIIWNEGWLQHEETLINPTNVFQRQVTVCCVITNVTERRTPQGGCKIICCSAQPDELLFWALVLPEHHLSIVAARCQETRLLGMPCYTIDILSVSSRHMGCKRKSWLCRIGAWVFFKYPDGIIPTGCGKRTSQMAPVWCKQWEGQM